MTTRTKIAAAGLLALSMAGIAATAVTAQNAAEPAAAGDDAAEAQAFGSATVTLAQAISAAESQAGGRAMSAEFDNGDDGEPSAYDVEVLKADGTMAELVVDAASGAVTADDETDDDAGQGENGQGENGEGTEGDDDEGGEGGEEGQEG